MPRRARTTTRRRRNKRRWRNPSKREIAIYASALVAAGLVGYGGFRFARSKRAGHPLPQGQGASSVLCELGPDYPGFVMNEDGVCMPTDATPPGIYVDVACQDFLFVPGSTGPQAERFAAMLEAARAASVASDDAPSADPTTVVTQFLAATWPKCTWPPSPTVSRLAQMFDALSFSVGRMIVHQDGIVLGTGLQSVVDEQVAERLAELGMPDFEPSIVPEIVLPEYPYDDIVAIPGHPAGTGPDIDQPPQGGGKLDLPDGVGPGNWPAPPGPFAVPGHAQPLKPCQKSPYKPPTYPLIKLDGAPWIASRTHDFKLFDFALGEFDECKFWNIRFGICLRPSAGAPYGQAVNPESPPTQPLRIRNANGQGIPWSTFTWTPLWKRQYSALLALDHGKAVAGNLKATSDPGVDPCPNDDKIWPTPADEEFLVMADTVSYDPRFAEMAWRPTPYVTLATEGTKVFARLHYTGMPRFLLGGADPAWGGINTPDNLDGELIAEITQRTGFIADYKVWALGAV